MKKMKLHVKRTREPVATVHRQVIKAQKLVYVITANRPCKYPHGKSPIVYIGTTSNGVHRILASVGYKALRILPQHGFKELHAIVITCGKRKHVRTWQKLERALLLQFREMFGQIPTANSHGARIPERDEFDYFTRTRIRKLIQSFE